MKVKMIDKTKANDDTSNNFDIFYNHVLFMLHANLFLMTYFTDQLHIMKNILKTLFSDYCLIVSVVNHGFKKQPCELFPYQCQFVQLHLEQ